MKFFLFFLLISFGCFVQAQDNNIQKEKYHYGNLSQDTLWGYTNVLKTGNVLYLSGVTSKGTFAEQVKNVYTEIEEILKKYGASFQNVVKENLYTLDIDSMKFYDYVRKPFYNHDFPAATWVQVSRLFVPGIMLEVEVVAHLSEKSPATSWPGNMIEGTWTMPTPNGIIGETWIKMDDNYFQSKGFIIKGNDTVTTEKVDLRKTANGVFYISTVSDQNNKQPVSFKLTSGNNNTFIFENPEHDSPKRIMYEFIDKYTLHAYIDDGDGRNRHDFYYKKFLK